MSSRRAAMGMAVLALAAVSPASAAASDIVEGVWSSSASAIGKVLVRATGPGQYIGAIVGGAYPPAGCQPDADNYIYPLGKIPWTLAGVGGSYTGLDDISQGCQVIGRGQTTWTVSPAPTGGLIMRQCVQTVVGEGAPTFDPQGNPTGSTQCTTLIRRAAPDPEPTFATAVSLPRAATCRGSAATVVLHDRSNDPLDSAKVSVNGRVMRSLTHLAARPAGLRVGLRHLPHGRYAIAVRATTLGGVIVSGRRTYRSCPVRFTGAPRAAALG